MADLDTRSKRASGVSALRPYMIAPVLPDGTIDQIDRQHVAWMYGGIAAGAAALTVLPLKSLVLDIGGGLGMTLMPSGNHLPITIATAIPSGEPPGDKGVIFVVTGGTLKIYAWDGSQWVVNN